MEPAWIKKARTYIGTKEIPGPKHNTVILGWLAALKAWWRDDETPWCGVFVAYIIRETLGDVGIPKYWMRAKEWASYGMPLAKGTPGAILVFNRTGGGHVGFYIGEDDTRYYVLGGNQSNAVNITPILKNRCTAIRWPLGVGPAGGPVRYSSAQAASVNEA